MLIRSTARGFTLVEIAIALVIAGLLATLALPMVGQVLANMRVRAHAEAIQTGLLFARSEAIKRNQKVEFMLFTLEAGAEYNEGLAATIAGNTAGPHWLVRASNAAGAYEHVQWKNGYSGSGQSEEGGSPATVTKACYPAALTPANIITFSGMGGTSLPATANIDISRPSAGTCNTAATPGPIRCLRLQVSVTGQVKICDPSVPAGDFRACTPPDPAC